MYIRIITLVSLLASIVHAAPMMDHDDAGTLHRSSDSVAESFDEPRALEKRIFSLKKLIPSGSSKDKDEEEQSTVYYVYFYKPSPHDEFPEPTMSPVLERPVPKRVRKHTKFLVDRFNEAYGGDSTPMSLVYQNDWFENARVRVLISSPKQETQSELFMTLGQESGSGCVLSNDDRELYASVVRFLDESRKPLPPLPDKSEKPKLPRETKQRMKKLVDKYLRQELESPKLKVYLNLQTKFVAPKSRKNSVWFSFTTSQSAQPLQAELKPDSRKDTIHKPAFPVSGGPS
ncbi:hypothetical protein EV361DRAFT_346746 [Lentinula raphanica]|uniref:Uncharacterized protein n=1 Tax=Lentinula raphanica TaxID=153919 RepID=A0AA38P5Q5_9AGAR|nr:hypothetical protein F5880DRAFT_663808 [Lentinula raphanica]KAJ3836827.1 hypothetical protein F5878DRAFT_243670 [Lentinula raphanica]KAJ3969503.1 hypothetical protein EV361DRAFT_346746 [Lentinula raphanica]